MGTSTVQQFLFYNAHTHSHKHVHPDEGPGSSGVVVAGTVDLAGVTAQSLLAGPSPGCRSGLYVQHLEFRSSPHSSVECLQVCS